VLSPAHALSLIATGEGIINFFMFFSLSYHFK